MRVRAVVPLVIACSAFASSSWAADIKPAECVAASEASLKLRDQHKLQAARDQLLICASASCPTEIREECVRRIERVNESIPMIVFEAKDAAGNDVSAVKVTMDGKPFADKLDGTALALDPGTHTFRFEAAGQPAVEKTLVVREVEKTRREAIVIGAAAGAPPSSGEANSSTSTSSWSAQKTVAVAVGGVGIAGLVVGGIFGGIAASKWSSAKEKCFGGTCPNYEQAVSDQESASSAALVSTVGFIAGGVAVAGAVALWLTAPSGERKPSTTAWSIVPGMGPRGGGLLLQRGF